jgi:transposase
MAKGFRPTDRDQQFLLPPDVRDWLPPDHLVWFVIDVLEQLDVSAFEARARLGGAGRAPYEPRMLLGVLVYGYALGQRSSRQLERLCQVDVGFRVLTGNQVPDHVTLARFRAAHEAAMAELFTQVLLLCARAGLGRLGVVAIDGTKIAANASGQANADEQRLRRLAGQIVDEASSVDAAEDERYGQARGDELPPGWRDRSGRRGRIRAALDDLRAEQQQRTTEHQAERVAAAHRRVELLQASLQRARAEVTAANQSRARREATNGPVPGTRPVPVDQHIKVRRARARLDRALSRRDAEINDPRPLPPRERARTTLSVRNTTDPDSRTMPTHSGWLQGFNAQLAVTDDQLILATRVTNQTVDDPAFVPMMTAATHAAAMLTAARPHPDPDETIGTVLADAGYHSTANLTAPGPDRLIAPGARREHTHCAATSPATGTPPPDSSPAQTNDHRLRTPQGQATYARRSITVEPVAGHLKDRIGLRRFARRGLTAAQAELDLAATVANLLKLYRTNPA